MTYSSSASIIINVPVEKVWDALTNPEQVKKYFFGTNMVTDWTIRSPIYFRGEWEGKSYEDKGFVLEYIPNKTLSYNYYSSMGGGEDKVELYQIIKYTLNEVDGGVEVKIEQSNTETQEKADHSTQNWSMVLRELKKLLV